MGVYFRPPSPADYRFRRMFGRKPDLTAILIWATQQALKGYGVAHPDMKRQRKTRQRDLMMWGARKIKGHYDAL